MPPQASKSGIKFYGSNKISQNFLQEGYIFKSMDCNFQYFCHLLPGFSFKCAHQSYDIMYIYLYSKIIIVMYVIFEAIAVDK